MVRKSLQSPELQCSSRLRFEPDLPMKMSWASQTFDQNFRALAPKPSIYGVMDDRYLVVGEFAVVDGTC